MNEADKIRQEIAELEQLAAQAVEIEKRFPEIEENYLQARELLRRCRMAPSRLRTLKRDYPGYFKDPAETEAAD